MDELDLRLLFERDREDGILSARLHGFEALAEEFTATRTRTIKRMSRNPFHHIRNACLSVKDAADKCGIPRSTAQAAATGRNGGGLTRWERRRLLGYLLDRREALDRAIEDCEERKRT